MLSIEQDVRFAFRQLRKSPGYATVAILTLALGIGANTAIFLLTYSILLKSLPVPDAAQLIRYTFRKGDSEIGLSWKQYRGLRKRQDVATGLFAWSDPQATLRRNGQSEKIPVGLATGSIFNVLQLHPVLGREFEPQAGEPGSANIPEALLTNDYWRTAFNADPNVIGQTLHIDSASVPIIGVLPPGFDGISPENPIKVLLPMGAQRILQPGPSALDVDGAFWLTVMGRLRPGATLAAAQANLTAIRKQVNEDADPSHQFLGGGFFSSYQLGVESGRGGRSWLRSKYSKPLVALEILCGLMMILCAVNVALLVLSRISGRLHEFAMRTALGASRSRMLSQVFTETLLLGAGGLVSGSFLGWEMAKLIHAMISTSGPGAPSALPLKAGFVLFTFAAAISIGAALCAGLWPAWRASHSDPAVDLKQTGASRTANRLGRWIIPAQVALGMVLLNAALLLSATLRTWLHENSGFDADKTVLSELNLDDAGVPEARQSAAAFDFLHRLQATPGVQSAALMNIAPLGNDFSVTQYYSRDAKGNLRINRQAWPEETSTSYFAVMGTSILQGRAFDTADVSGDRVCILSSAAATFFFPGQSAMGQSLNDGDGREKASERRSCRVIGIAQDAHLSSLLDPPPLVVYSPIERASADSFTYATVGARAATPQLAAEAIRRAYKAVFPSAPLPRTWTFADAIDYNLSRQRLLSSVSGGFALLALALVATGLYGILARSVVDRRREIGIRMALGARRQQIIRNLARTAASRIAIGIAAGAALAFFAGRLLQSLLYGVTAASPLIAAATLALLLAVLALAFIVPAGRAASIDPMEAIRDE